MINLYPVLRPFVFSIDPERAHSLTIGALKTGGAFLPKSCKDDPALAVDAFGLTFPNPIGLAAGFDKDAEVIDPILRLGFGFSEAGTVTPKPQPGNDKPRIFRLAKDQGVINRFGFNSKGLESFAGRLRARQHRPGIVGANVGANKTSADRTADYEAGIDALYGLSQYFTVNISSPNTPGLRALQSKAALDDLLARVSAVRSKKIEAGHAHIPILLKVAPDLTDEDKADIVAALLDSDFDGLIVSNTTITRPDSLSSANRDEAGGLSGAPLTALALEALSDFYELIGEKVPIIGVGGITSGADAYARIKAGATLIQLYSALVFHGTGLVGEIKSDLLKRMKADGFKRIQDVVGANHR